MKKKDDHQEEGSDSEMRQAGCSTARKDETGGTFVLRDASFGGGGGVPGVDPDDWASIKHLVRGAGG